MDKPQTILRLNVEHYGRLLATESDPTRRETIAKLLAEQEARLDQLEKLQKRERHA